MKNAKSQVKIQGDAAEKKLKATRDRVNKKVNDKIFPALKSISKNVEEGKLIPSVLKTVIQQAILNRMMLMKVADLNLMKELKGASKETLDQYGALITLLNDEPIAIAYQILDGLTEEITLKERAFMTKYSLDALYGAV